MQLTQLTMMKKNQTGAALFTALLFLVLLTILGVTSLQSSSLQEKMAGNMQLSTQVASYAEDAVTLVKNTYSDPANVGNLVTSLDESTCLVTSGALDGAGENTYQTCTLYKGDAPWAEGFATDLFEANVYAIRATGSVEKSGTTLAQTRLRKGISKRVRKPN